MSAGIRVMEPPRTETGLSGRRSLPGRLRPFALGVAGLSASAGVVHLSVVSGHLAEGVAFAMFFALLAAFQLGWAALAAARPRPALYAGAIAVNAVVAAIWLVSRTTGLPFGPHAGIPEPVAAPDLLATVLELAVVAGSAVLLRPLGRARALAGAIGRGVLALPLAVAPVTVLAAVGGSQGGHHAGEAIVPGHAALPAHSLELLLLAAASVLFAVHLVLRWRRS